MVSNDDIENQLLESFPDAEIEVDNPKGDDIHFKITITSSKFNNTSRIEQHKLVYKALGNKFNKCGHSLHAIELKTSPKE